MYIKSFFLFLLFFFFLSVISHLLTLAFFLRILWLYCSSLGPETPSSERHHLHFPNSQRLVTSLQRVLLFPVGWHSSRALYIFFFFFSLLTIHLSCLFWLPYHIPNCTPPLTTHGTRIQILFHLVYFIFLFYFSIFLFFFHPLSFLLLHSTILTREKRVANEVCGKSTTTDN